MPDNDESKFMLAAEKSIRDLQDTVSDLQQAATEAKNDAHVAKDAADRASNSARTWRVLTIVLGIVVVITLAVSALSANLYFEQRNSTSQLRQQAISSCEAGNSRATAEVEVWDHILNEFLVSPHTSQQTKDFVHESEKFLANKLSQRNCTQAYAPPPASIGSLYATPALSIPVGR